MMVFGWIGGAGSKFWATWQERAATDLTEAREALTSSAQLRRAGAGSWAEEVVFVWFGLVRLVRLLACRKAWELGGGCGATCLFAGLLACLLNKRGIPQFYLVFFGRSFLATAPCKYFEFVSRGVASDMFSLRAGKKRPPHTRKPRRD